MAHEVEKLARIKLESPVTLPPVRSSPSVLTESKDSPSSTKSRGSLKSRSSNGHNDELVNGRLGVFKGRTTCIRYNGF